MADLEEVDVSKNIDEDDDEIQLSEPEQDVEEDEVEEGEIPENDDNKVEEEVSENDDNKVEEEVSENDEDELEEGEVYEGDDQEIKLKNQEELAKLSIPENKEEQVEDSDSSDSDDDEDSLELQKIETDIDKSTLLIYHPELKQINYKELLTLSKITRNKKGIIIDPLHKTIPFLTRYEKAKILGLRAKQINNGSDPFVDVPRNIINGHTIALMELNEKNSFYN